MATREGIYTIDVPKQRKTKKDIEYVITKNGCWEAISHRIKGHRYPEIRQGNKIIKLHRYMYEKFIGKIPDGLIIRHKCDNTFCINPEHLEIGTQLDNMQDASKRDRIPNGIKSKNAKLTEEDVKNIREDNIHTYYQLAEIYNIHHSTAWQVKNNKRWRHIK